MSIKKFTVGSLFAGIGGICSAFEQAGSEVIWANELDSKACQTYRHNYPKTILIEKDINELVEDNLTYRSNNPELLSGSTNTLPIPPVDIITSGFPCQAFSIAGYRQGFNDEKGRGNLFFRTAEFIERIQPKAFLLENVKNLATHDKGKTIKVIRDTIINELNYSFIMFILNAKDYGNIPQNRERVYIVGFRGEGKYINDSKTKDINIKTHQFKIPESMKLTKSIHDILDHDKQDDRFYYPPGSRYYDQLNETMKSQDTVYQWRRVYVRENKSNVCPTLTANMGTGGHNVPLIRDSFGIRKLTPTECVRFQGFPEDFNFPEKMAMSHRYKQAGNSVVVPVVKRIASEILRVL